MATRWPGPAGRPLHPGRACYSAWAIVFRVYARRSQFRSPCAGVSGCRVAFSVRKGILFMAIGGQGRMREEKIYLTPEGKAEMEAKLHYLRTVKRPQVADYIHEAKEAGDVSES